MKLKKIKIPLDSLEMDAVWEVWARTMQGTIETHIVTGLLLLEQRFSIGEKMQGVDKFTLSLSPADTYALYYGLMACPMLDGEADAVRNALADRITKLAMIHPRNQVQPNQPFIH